MSTTDIIVLAVFSIIIIASISYFISAYNELVRLKKSIAKNWSNIDVSLKLKSHGLNPSLLIVANYIMTVSISTIQPLNSFQPI